MEGAEVGDGISKSRDSEECFWWWWWGVQGFLRSTNS